MLKISINVIFQRDLSLPKLGSGFKISRDDCLITKMVRSNNQERQKKRKKRGCCGRKERNEDAVEEKKEKRGKKTPCERKKSMERRGCLRKRKEGGANADSEAWSWYIYKNTGCTDTLRCTI
ncbi:unnamed protein product [Cuscuta europaea]|uniref:Uncharacterized protein n=1 Tax=Cuscuta europaea TaxID=41803 RepID=A0A9P0ZTR3_CUSEU|nr:unnamed protein product [Cuscuta europaea]